MERVTRAVHPLYAARERVYVNAASWGLLPSTAIQASRSFTQRRDGTAPLPDSEFFETLDHARRASSALIGCAPADIVLCPNTSFGVNLGAWRLLGGTRRGEGEPGAIVISEGEFPANVYPWLALEAHGFEVRMVPALPNGWPDEEALLDALDGPNVRALALSAVQFASGYAADLEEFGRRCSDRGILFVVDAIQGLGGREIDVQAARIDVLACGAQKWLCSPWGSGFAYVPQRHRQQFDPPMVSWLGFEGATDFENMLGYRYTFENTGVKFELATHGFQNYAGMNASLSMFLEAGLQACRDYVLALQRPVLEWIDSRTDVEVTSSRVWEQRSGILMFRTPDVAATHRALEEAGVVCVVREGSIRLSPHVYNRPDEIDYLVEVLEG